MAQTEKKTGTRKEVNEQTARSDAELTKHKKTGRVPQSLNRYSEH
jgi:hypothetical protein